MLNIEASVKINDDYKLQGNGYGNFALVQILQFVSHKSEIVAVVRQGSILETVKIEDLVIEED